MSRGFLMNDVSFRVNRDSFIDSHHNSILITRLEKHQPVMAYECSLKFNTKDIISTLGEFFEREVLINSNPIQREKIIATSLYTGEKKKVAISKIVFSGVFVDSCGMSSHTISSETIRNSYVEFFERQSFLLNFLSKSTGVKIDISKNHELMEYELYLKQFIDETKYYDISMDKRLHVILVICTGKMYKTIGLGTNECLYKAVLKAQMEALQYFASSTTKHGNKGIGYSTNKSIQKDYYHSNFDKLSSDDLKNLYSYLDQSKITIEVTKRKNKELDLTQLIQLLYRNYNIHPFISCIPSKRNIPNLKITKVFDENWFPHMNPKYYSQSMYDFIEESTGKFLDRSIEFIPFP